MKVITRNNKKYYKYAKKPLTEGIKLAILLFAIAIILFAIGIFISYMCDGKGPMIVGGLGISSILFNFASMWFIIMEIYLYKNFQPAIRNMLLLQLVYIIFWVFII